jgi:hypothetical protein
MCVQSFSRPYAFSPAGHHRAVIGERGNRAMGVLLKYSAVLILAVFAGFIYEMNEESFFTAPKRLALFNSYLKRASDPHEIRLRLGESKISAQNGIQGKLTVATLKFVDERYYLKTFSKTYKLVLSREAYINNHDLDSIEAGLYMVADYGVREEHEVIFNTGKVRKKDAYWNALNSFFDNPVHSVRKKILKNDPGNSSAPGSRVEEIMVECRLLGKAG